MVIQLISRMKESIIKGFIEANDSSQNGDLNLKDMGQQFHRLYKSSRTTLKRPISRRFYFSLQSPKQGQRRAIKFKRKYIKA